METNMTLDDKAFYDGVLRDIAALEDREVTKDYIEDVLLILSSPKINTKEMLEFMGLSDG